jgi:hypothetical protein
MKNLHLLLLPALLVATTACKKDSETAPAPTKTAMLTGTTWKDATQTMTINGAAGTYTTPASDVIVYQFAADGTLTTTQGTAAPQKGTWALANNDTQLKTTMNGKTTTVEVFDLTAKTMSIGWNYNQAQVQAALAAGSSDPLPLLILSASAFTFPANTPTVTPSQITSFRFQTNLVPR